MIFSEHTKLYIFNSTNKEIELIKVTTTTTIFAMCGLLLDIDLPRRLPSGSVGSSLHLP